MAAAEGYPDDLRYHSAHDGALGGRRRGDSGHHVVRAGLCGASWLASYDEPPDVGATLSKESVYGRGGSRRRPFWISIAPLSGVVVEVNQKAVDEPDAVNEDPYGEGWLVRIRLSDPTELDGLLDANAYQQLLAE